MSVTINPNQISSLDDLYKILSEGKRAFDDENHIIAENEALPHYFKFQQNSVIQPIFAFNLPDDNIDEFMMQTDSGIQQEYQLTRRDFFNSDVDKNKVVTNAELMAYLQTTFENPEELRKAIIHYRQFGYYMFDILPAYLKNDSQLSREEVSTLKGLLKAYAEQNEEVMPEADYLIDLKSFKEANPPFIIKALMRNLSPEELVLSRKILEHPDLTQINYHKIKNTSATALTTDEITLLTTCLFTALEKGDVVLDATPNQTQPQNPLDTIVEECLSFETETDQLDCAARIFADSQTETKDELSIPVLLKKINKGELTPSETQNLRLWMQTYAWENNIDYTGAAGWKSILEIKHQLASMTENPTQVAFGLGVFIAVFSLHKGFQNNAFEHGLRNKCGSPLDETLRSDAREKYQQFVKQKLAQDSKLTTHLRKIFQNENSIIQAVVDLSLIEVATHFGFPLISNFSEKTLGQNVLDTGNEWANTALYSAMLALALLAVHNAAKPTYKDFFENGFDASICDNEDLVEKPQTENNPNEVHATAVNDISDFVTQHPFASIVTALGGLIFTAGWLTPGLPDGELVGGLMVTSALGSL